MTNDTHVHVWLDHIVDVDTGGKAVTEIHCLLCGEVPPKPETSGYNCDVTFEKEFDFRDQENQDT